MAPSAKDAFSGKTESEVVSLLNEMAGKIASALKAIVGDKDERLAKISDDVPDIQEYTDLVEAYNGSGDNKVFDDLDEDTKAKWVSQYDQAVQHAGTLNISLD